MKKYISSLSLIINILYQNTLLSCPAPFCPEDKRPFFEQYEIEDNNTMQPKEKK